MPQKYRITTDQGAYDVTVDDFDVNAQNATMRQNMAAQDTAATRPPESEFTLPKIFGRAVSGAKGELEGAAGGLVGLAALPVAGYQAIMHPIDTAKGLGKGAMMAAGLAKQAYDKPSETVSAITNAATRFGTDPEKIGALAGATGVAIATPGIIRGIRGTRIGQAVGTGLSSAVDRVPGVKEARGAWAASAPEAMPISLLADPLRSGRIGPTPLELTRSLKPKGAALESAREQAFAQAGPPAQVAAEPMVTLYRGVHQGNTLAGEFPDKSALWSDSLKAAREYAAQKGNGGAVYTVKVPASSIGKGKAIEQGMTLEDVLGDGEHRIHYVPPSISSNANIHVDKPSFSAQDVLKIKLLIQQGLSQADAVQLVKQSVLGNFLRAR